MLTVQWPTIIAAFLASLVEFVEALTSVLAVGAVRALIVLPVLLRLPAASYPSDSATRKINVKNFCALLYFCNIAV